MFIGCIVLVIFAISFGMPWKLAVIAGIALFIILLQTIGRRFKRFLGNNDIAFWMISTRILPPVVIIIPIVCPIPESWSARYKNRVNHYLSCSQPTDCSLAYARLLYEYPY